MSEPTPNVPHVCTACKNESLNVLNLTTKTTLSASKKSESGWFYTRHYVTMMLFFAFANYFVIKAYIPTAVGTMVNLTTTRPERLHKLNESTDSPNEIKLESSQYQSSLLEEKFVWDQNTVIKMMQVFYLGYELFLIPSAILSRLYGSVLLIGYGSLFSSALGLVIPTAMEIGGTSALGAIRVLQGVGMAPTFPCSIDLLSKWILPTERSRCVAFVISGAQFGLLICNQISGLLSSTSFGWPCIFYFFGSVAIGWSVIFLVTVYDNPDSNRKMDPNERKLIKQSIKINNGNVTNRISDAYLSSNKILSIPLRRILTSWPFNSTLVAHICINIGFFVLVVVPPTYYSSVFQYDKKEINLFASIPLFIMWIAVIATGWTADHYFSKGYSRTRIMKLSVALGSLGPGILLLTTMFSSPGLNVASLSISLGLTGVMYTSINVNHLDLSQNFAGFLMSLTYGASILMSVFVMQYNMYLLRSNSEIQDWRLVFSILSVIYFVTGIFCTIFSSAEIQPWDNVVETRNRNTRVQTVSESLS